MEIVVSRLLLFAGIYLAIGFLFSLFFVVVGVGKVDPVARRGTWGFRLLILPGVVALWPLFTLRLLRGVTDPPVENNAHRKAARSKGAGS